MRSICAFVVAMAVAMSLCAGRVWAQTGPFTTDPVVIVNYNSLGSYPDQVTVNTGILGSGYSFTNGGGIGICYDATGGGSSETKGFNLPLSFYSPPSQDTYYPGPGLSNYYNISGLLYFNDACASNKGSGGKGMFCYVVRLNVRDSNNNVTMYTFWSTYDSIYTTTFSNGSWYWVWGGNDSPYGHPFAVRLKLRKVSHSTSDPPVLSRW